MNDHHWLLGTATGSFYDADGYLGVSYDSDGSEGGGLSSGADATPIIPSGGTPQYETITPGGLLFRPLDPTVDANGNPNAALSPLSLMLFEGGRGYSIPLTDPRTVVKLPPLGKGDCVLYGGGGVSCVRIVGSGKSVGRITTFTTTDGTPDGQSVYLKVWPDSFGMVAPWGNFILDANRCSLNHIASGARLDMGGIGGLPGPASQLSSYASISAAAISLKGTIVKLGVAGPLGYAPVFVMNAVAMTYFTQLQTALGLLAATIGGFVGDGAFPGLPAAIAAITALDPPILAVSATAVAG